MNTPIQHPEIYMLNQHIITLSWNSVEYEKITQNIHLISNYINDKLSVELTDLVPCYNSITLYYKNPLNDMAINILKGLIREAPNEQKNLDSLLKIPVCFDDCYALDLDYMSKFLNISAEDIVYEFCSKTYSVAFLGFLPGFPYLNGLSRKLATPRKSSPRTSIVSGAVGIAGKQAGIYPQDSPGGWNIIGNCPLNLFNAAQAPYALFQPGDKVRFFKVEMSEFQKITAEKTDLFNLRKMLLQGV